MTDSPRKPPLYERTPENAGFNPVSDATAKELARRHMAAMDAAIPLELQHLLDRLTDAEEKKKKP